MPLLLSLVDYKKRVRTKMWEMAALGRQGVVCVLEHAHIANRHTLGDLVLKITWNAED